MDGRIVATVLAPGIPDGFVIFVISQVRCFLHRLRVYVEVKIDYRIHRTIRFVARVGEAI